MSAIGLLELLVIALNLWPVYTRETLDCLSAGNYQRWQSACKQSNNNPQNGDDVCRNFRQWSKPQTDCNPLPYSANYYHKGIYIQSKLRDHFCKSIKDMVRWQEEHSCSFNFMKECLKSAGPQYDIYQTFFPNKIESLWFIYKFCEQGPPFYPRLRINDNCLEVSTAHCWDVVVQKHNGTYERFCELLKRSLECQLDYINAAENSGTCEKNRYMTGQFLIDVFMYQQHAVCSGLYIMQPDLTLPIGMMRYYDSGFLIKHGAVF